MREIMVIANEEFLCSAGVADSTWQRALGLLGRKPLPTGRGLLIPRCRSIHTMFMRFPIDAVYVDGQGAVVKVEHGLKPFRLSAGGYQTHSVLELPAGLLEGHHLGVGDVLQFAEPVSTTSDYPGHPPGKELNSYDNGVTYRILRPDRLADGAPGWLGAAGSIAAIALGVISSPVLFFGLGLYLGTWGIEKFLVRPPLKLARNLRRPRRSRPSKLMRKVATARTAEMAIAAIAAGEHQGGTSKVVGPRVGIPCANGFYFDPSVGIFLNISGQDEERHVKIGAKPETIGTGERCSVRLPLAPGVAAEHVRIWWRDGQLMLHHLAEGLSTMVNRKDVGWTSLREGDEIWIGPYLLRISGEPTAPELFTPLERASLVNEERRVIGTGFYRQSM